MPHGSLAHLAGLRVLWSSPVNAAAVDRLAPRPGEHVLDLGSGLGPASVLTAPRVAPGGSVTAVDPTRSLRLALLLRTAPRRLPGRGPSPRVLAGSAEDLPLEAGSTDAAISLNALHHYRDLARAAAELHRVLVPGGRALLVDEDFDHPGHGLHHCGSPSDHGHPAVDPDEVAGLLRAAGFTRAAGTREVLGGQPALVIEATR